MTETNRRKWNQQHAIIRRLLMKEKNYRRALPLLLEHHAAVHSGKLPPLRGGGREPAPARVRPGGRGARWSYQDEVLGPLSEAQFRMIPPGGQSVIWKIWHITRIEDLTQNLLLAGNKKSLLDEKWLKRLGIDYVDVGNGMPEADAARISKLMNVKALLAYRLAVGKRSRTIFRRLDPARLWEKPAPERLQRILDEKGVRENAAWLLKFWGGNPYANLLLMPATRHPFVHLNEISRMTPRVQRG